MISASIKGPEVSLCDRLYHLQNLTVIEVAYGEVLWFGGSVTSLTLVTSVLMVWSFVVAACADVQSVSQSGSGSTLSTLNVG